MKQTTPIPIPQGDTVETIFPRKRSPGILQVTKEPLDGEQGGIALGTIVDAILLKLSKEVNV